MTGRSVVAGVPTVKASRVPIGVEAILDGVRVLYLAVATANCRDSSAAIE